MLKIITELYESGMTGLLIAKQIERSPSYVYNELKKSGLKINKGGFKKGHKPNQEQCSKISKALTGRKFSKEHKEKISKAMSGKANPNFGKKCNSHGKRCYWKCYNGDIVSLRSRWEAAYAEYLDSKNIKWTYENKTFTLNDGSAYTPDFYLIDSKEFIEVKGWFHNEHKEKVKKFKETHPNEKWKILFKSDLLNLGIPLNKEYSGLERPTGLCLNCNKIFIKQDKKRQFCSKQCSNKFIATHDWNIIEPKKYTKQKYNGNQSGENNNGSTVSKEMAIKVIEMRKSGSTLIETSIATGVSIGNIGNIVKGRSWKELNYLRI